jgi:hypothetical protein
MHVIITTHDVILLSNTPASGFAIAYYAKLSSGRINNNNNNNNNNNSSLASNGITCSSKLVAS